MIASPVMLVQSSTIKCVASTRLFQRSVHINNKCINNNNVPLQSAELQILFTYMFG